MTQKDGSTHARPRRNACRAHGCFGPDDWAHGAYCTDECPPHGRTRKADSTHELPEDSIGYRVRHYPDLLAERDQLREEMRNLGKDWVERWAYENVMAQRDRYRAALEEARGCVAICPEHGEGPGLTSPLLARIDRALDPTEAPPQESPQNP